jgi:hypothetical protein
MEFEEKYSDEFIAEVKESEEAYRKGEYLDNVTFHLPQRTLSSQRKFHVCADCYFQTLGIGNFLPTYLWVIILVQVVKEIKGHISTLYPLRSL